jgi:hypothetical protein
MAPLKPVLANSRSAKSFSQILTCRKNIKMRRPCPLFPETRTLSGMVLGRHAQFSPISSPKSDPAHAIEHIPRPASPFDSQRFWIPSCQLTAGHRQHRNPRHLTRPKSAVNGTSRNFFFSYSRFGPETAFEEVTAGLWHRSDVRCAFDWIDPKTVHFGTLKHDSFAAAISTT